MYNYKKIFYPVCLLLVLMFSCVPKISKKDLKTDFSKKKIQGFDQFAVYRSSSLLGYVPSGKGKFNFRVWEGLIKKDKVRQSIKISYTGRGAYEFSARFLKVAKVALKRNNVTSINLHLINPVEYILKNPYPSIQYVKKKDFLQKPYIGSVLKVEKIRVEFVQTNGMVISGKASIYKIGVKGKYKLNESENAVYFADNVFIGYKLFDPPSDAKSLASFSLDYQFLVLPKDTSKWVLLSPHDSIKSGDNIKINVRSSHLAYVYLFNLDSGGNINIMFPNKDAGYNNPLEGGKIYHFPKDRNRAYEVDNVDGVEEFVFMVFRHDDQRVKVLLKKIKKGQIKKDQFHKESVVMQTRGVGKIKKIKVLKNKKTPGFNFSVKQIKGLASDYRDVFILRHIK